jgi:HAD superfamily hydrolase (TIGR01458 family)
MSLSVKALLLDLSGVLYEGDQAITGAAEALSRAREQQRVMRFVTNTATKSATKILSDLAAMGIAIAEEELFTAPIAAKTYIKEQGLRPYCLIHQALHAEFACLPQNEPNCVLIGDAREALTYDNLNKAFRLCQAGAPLIGIGMNRYFKGSDGLMLDAGGFIRLIEWAAGIEATIMGKPSKTFFEQVVASTGFAPRDCVMVGDDVHADVIGAIEAGLQGCLVRTGKYQPGDENLLPDPSQVIPSIATLF